MLQPILARSLRYWAIGWIALGHVAALVLFAFASWWLALAVLLPAGLAWVWGTLNPHSRLLGSVVRRLRADEGCDEVCLSFDDGPSVDTLALLDVLDRYRARAIFFMVGERVLSQPELAREIVRRGHEIGNHSHTHPAGGFWALPPGRLRTEIEQAQQALIHVTGVRPRWFRAVAGHANPFVDPVLRRLGLTRMSWTLRSFDSVDPNDDRVLARLLSAVEPGAILLLHEDSSAPGRCVRLLDRLLAQLSERGYSTLLPVPDGEATNSQLLNGVRPHRGAACTVVPSAVSSASSSVRRG